MSYPMAAIQAAVSKATVLAGGGDVTAPTCTITCAQSSPSATTPLNFTFTFSESVMGFVVGDITVGNGTAGNFAGSGAVYTADVTPVGMSVVTVDVAAGVCQDAAGNANLAATQFTIISIATFLDAFTRANGDLGNGWEYTAGKWTVSGNAAVATPGLGSDLIVNGGFGADTDWTKEASWTIGSGVASLAAEAANRKIYQNALSLNTFVRIDWTITALTQNSLRIQAGGMGNITVRSTAGTYIDTINVIGSALIGVNGFSSIGSIDNISAKQLTTADLFATRDFETADIDIEVPLTITPGVMVGAVLCLDSVATPANYIIVALFNSSLYVFKCTNGTISAVLTQGAITYVAGQVLRVLKSGTTVQMFYNGVQIGINVTVSDASIKDNTRHGMFDTASGSSIASFTANPT